MDRPVSISIVDLPISIAFKDEKQNMKNYNKTWIASISAVAVSVIVVGTGCEWSGGGGAQSSSGRYNFVNFSGVYTGADGGLLVTDYSRTGANSTNLVTSERLATGDGLKTAFSGVLRGRPIVEGSVSITIPPIYTMTDSNGDGVMSISPAVGGASGLLNYDTGAWSITLPFAVNSGDKITATYQSTFSSSSGGNNGASGASGKTIYSFNVEHYGNLLKLIDNNGAVYEGEFGDIRSTGGLNQNSETGTVAVGETFVGSFSVSGVSAANMKVKVVGQLNGRVQTVSGSSFVFGGRTITGTWVEQGGVVGNVNGSAAAVNLSVSP